MFVEGKKKKVGIIGAGPSGILAAKYALQYGLEPEVYEKSSGLGGIWNQDSGSVWRQMTTNISKYTVSFMGHPWPEKAPLHPLSSEVTEYLQGYAKKYHVDEHISFDCKVISVSRKEVEAETGTGTTEKKKVFMVTIKKDEEIIEKQYEYLIIASGIFNVPYIPKIEGIEQFKGQVIHSKVYRDGKPFTGKKVLIIGGSFTGVQIASNISKYAQKVYHSFKRPFWIMPHKVGPQDRKLPLDFGNTREGYIKKVTHYDQNVNFSKICHQQQQYPELRIDEKQFGSAFQRPISSTYLTQLKLTKLTPIKSTVTKFTPTSVILTSLTQPQSPPISLQIDTIIFCTGYKPGLNYFSPEILQIMDYQQNDPIQPVILYREMYHPKLENLFFIGMYKNPLFGAFEMQVQFAIRKICGMIGELEEEEVERGLEEEREIRVTRVGSPFPHPDYVILVDKISKAAGNKLDISEYLKDPTNPESQQFFKMPVFPYLTSCFTTDNISEQLAQSNEIVKNALQKNVKVVAESIAVDQE